MRKEPRLKFMRVARIARNDKSGGRLLLYERERPEYRVIVNTVPATELHIGSRILYEPYDDFGVFSRDITTESEKVVDDLLERLGKPIAQEPPPPSPPSPFTRWRIRRAHWVLQRYDPTYRETFTVARECWRWMKGGSRFQAADDFCDWLHKIIQRDTEKGE